MASISRAAHRIEDKVHDLGQRGAAIVHGVVGLNSTFNIGLNTSWTLGHALICNLKNQSQLFSDMVETQLKDKEARVRLQLPNNAFACFTGLAESAFISMIKRNTEIDFVSAFGTDSAVFNRVFPAVIASTITFPFELVKLRKTLKYWCNVDVDTTVEDIFQKEGGLMALYQGFGPKLIYDFLTTLISEAIIHYRPFVLSNDVELNAFLIRIMVMLGLNPLEVLWKKIAASKTNNKNLSLLTHINDIYEREGILGFFRGALWSIPEICTPAFVKYLYKKFA